MLTRDATYITFILAITFNLRRDKPGLHSYLPQDIITKRQSLEPEQLVSSVDYTDHVDECPEHDPGDCNDGTNESAEVAIDQED